MGTACVSAALTRSRRSASGQAVMTSIPLVPGLKSVVSPYEALLCDVWGVIHNGREAFPGVVDCLKAARADGRLVLLLSNAPRPSGPIREQLASLRVPSDAYDAIVTSG